MVKWTPTMQRRANIKPTVIQETSSACERKGRVSTVRLCLHCSKIKLALKIKKANYTLKQWFSKCGLRSTGGSSEDSGHTGKDIKKKQLVNQDVYLDQILVLFFAYSMQKHFTQLIAWLLLVIHWQVVIGDGDKVSDDCFDELQTDPRRPVAVHLFEWKWTDIANECETFLKDTGIGLIQVSPPNEHAVFEHKGDYSWWLRYQPVSYLLHSRSGTEKEFIDMVQRCMKVGIKILVDGVINHMVGANMKGYGSGGSYYNSTPFKESFPAVPYGPSDFNDDICNNNIKNYGNAAEVRNCRLVSLIDLKLSKVEVQQKIADYLNHLIDIGVAGFRIDAAKHMWPDDIRNILKRVKHLNPAYYPKDKCAFVFHEVIDQGAEAIQGSEYVDFGRITNFRYGLDLSAAVMRNENFLYFKNFGPEWNYWKSHDVLVFVDNHDNQRGSGGGGKVLTYKTPKMYKLAVSFMLAWNYGIPRLMSSYYFDGHDMGPPSFGKPDFKTKSPTFTPDGLCNQSSGWVCEHRWHEIKRMTLFSASVAGLPNTNIISDNHRIAFSRGSNGFYALNNDPHNAWVVQVQTSLPAGFYCDFMTGSVTNKGCSGKTIEVTTDGKVKLIVEPETAVAISVASKLTLPPSYKRTVVLIHFPTVEGQNVFIRGGVHSSHRKGCKADVIDTPCSIPIIHIEDVQSSWKKFIHWRSDDYFLDWSTGDNAEGSSTIRTPLAWSTNNKNQAGYQWQNKYGEHYWFMDVLMDCNRTESGWFEFQSARDSSNLVENAIKQTKCNGDGGVAEPPFTTTFHAARCGFVNVFQFNTPACTIEKRLSMQYIAVLLSFTVIIVIIYAHETDAAVMHFCFTNQIIVNLVILCLFVLIFCGIYFLFIAFYDVILNICYDSGVVMVAFVLMRNEGNSTHVYI
ncbi:Pancreatic alpha-amylase, partial [Trichinella nelsoni]